MSKISDEDCGIRKAMNLVGSKWKVMLLRKMRRERMRYGDIKRLIPEISEKVLIQELKDLVKAGLMEKKSYPEIPPKVEYWLTDKGINSLPLLDSIVAFGEANF